MPVQSVSNLPPALAGLTVAALQPDLADPTLSAKPPPKPAEAAAEAPASDAAKNNQRALATTVARIETQANADGSITTITTYGDGNRSTTIGVNPAAKSAPPVLDPKNAPQFGALLTAQEQSRAHTVITFSQSSYAT